MEAGEGIFKRSFSFTSEGVKEQAVAMRELSICHLEKRRDLPGSGFIQHKHDFYFIFFTKKPENYSH